LGEEHFGYFALFLFLPPIPAIPDSRDFLRYPNPGHPERRKKYVY
jgi:hypothetical protein